MADNTVRRLVVVSEALPSSDEERDEVLLTYPLQGKGRLTIYGRDLECLVGKRYLNDQVINVFCKLQCVGPDGRYRDAQTYLCDSHLYTQVTLGLSGTITGEQLRANFEKVSRWFPQNGPFHRRLVLVPICEGHHWYLVVAIRSEDTGYEVCLLDSYGASVRKHAADVVCHLIRHRTKAPVRASVRALAVRQQGNDHDCGLHLTHNIERVLQWHRKGSIFVEAELVKVVNEEPCPLSRTALKAAILGARTKAQITADSVAASVEAEPRESNAVDDMDCSLGSIGSLPSNAGVSPTVSEVERIAAEFELDGPEDESMPSAELALHVLEPDQFIQPLPEIELVNRGADDWEITPQALQEALRLAIQGVSDCAEKRRRRAHYQRRIDGELCAFRVYKARCTVSWKQPRPKVDEEAHQ